MAYRIGTANGYLDLLLMLKRFVESAKQITNIAYDGGNTGDGYISAEGANDSAGDETWTVAFTSATEFTVTGSVSGLQTATGTVGTEYSSDGGEITFTAIAGNTAWAAGDEITFDVADGLGTQKWTVDEYADSDVDGSPEKQLIMHGPGTSGNDEIYIGIQTYRNVSEDYYNWTLQGYTGYNSASLFSSQPGAIVSYVPRIYLQNREIRYWIIANGRRISMVTEIDGVYESMYMGFILPYGYPNEFPYPLAIGGCGVTQARRYSYEGAGHRAYFDPYGSRSGASIVAGTMKLWHGGWVDIGNRYDLADANDLDTYSGGHTFPYFHSEYSLSGPNSFGNVAGLWFSYLRQNIDGSYPVFPVVLWRMHTERVIWGELDGILALPGPSLNAEDVFTLDSKNYLVFQDTYRTGIQNYAAMKLE